MNARRKGRQLEMPPRLRVVETPDSAEAPRKGVRDENLSYTGLIEKLVAEELHTGTCPARPHDGGD